MYLPPIGRGSLADNIRKVYTEDWIFSTKLEKLIIIFLTGYTIFSFLRWLIL